MKKLNLLLIVAMLATALLAANPVGRLVRLTIINNSGDVLYMKLEGEVTGQFYYLTIAKDDTRTFTVLTDFYKRTTWACNGLKSTGRLIMTGNVRLNFVPCYTIPMTWKWIDLDLDGVGKYGGFGPRIIWVDPGDLYLRVVNLGEPTQEKVVYFETYLAGYFWWSCGFGILVDVKVKIPFGCFYRYRY
jgi:hypothetical protein